MNTHDHAKSNDDDASEWQVEVASESLKIDPAITYDDDHVDWDRSAVVVMLRGSAQSGYDLVDALTAASTFYSMVAHRDRRSAPDNAQIHRENAPRISALAALIEAGIDAAMTLRADRLNGVGSNSEPADAQTAMDVVRSAERGEISHDQLISTLHSWDFEPKHRTRGLADDWESRPNSFEVVEYAFTIDLIDEDAYQRILEGVG